MKKFSPEATFAYAKLVNDFVQVEATEDFNKAFEDFMNAYEKADDDGTFDEIINPTQKIVFNDTPVNKCSEPKPGDVYVDACGHRYFVVAVKALVATEEKPSSVDGICLVIPCVVLKRLVGNHVADTRVMTLKEFADAAFTKEE